ncbi:L,D-transpeptidase family protein [Streptomyces sp. NPDC050610]|uniref:L,D-transpeptidase family protein n=1 Tax=Streptomyces sp. NPDC050610 TaxID=3157097 RepID=UPI00341E62EF
MKGRAAALAAATALTAVLGLAPPAHSAPPPVPPLPSRMADTGGGTQLITAEAARTDSTTGTLTWWERRRGGWRAAGSAPARFGAKGLTEGRTREQGTNTTPTGLYALPYAFGNDAAPAGARTPYREVTPDSWWCEDNASRSYNRWVEGLPSDCAAKESEHLADYPVQYSRALVIAFNYTRPVHGRGAGIFLHVDGRGATAGCVSVPASAMSAVLTWLRPSARPHIAIGTRSGPTAITRY